MNATLYTRICPVCLIETRIAPVGLFIVHRRVIPAGVIGSRNTLCKGSGTRPRERRKEERDGPEE